MIIQNLSGSQSTLPSRFVSNDAPTVVADTSAPTLVSASPTKVTTQLPSQPLTSEQLKNAVDNINKAMQQSNLSLEFSVDPNTKTPVVKMMDSESGKVIRQYPSEEVLAIAQSIDQYLSEHQSPQGLLLKQQA